MARYERRRGTVTVPVGYACFSRKGHRTQYVKSEDWKGIFIWIGAVLGPVRASGPARPQTCPYRPLISYKIGQMPTITRGG